MKNLEKRIERLEKRLKPVQPSEEPKKPNVDTLGLTFEERQGIREFFESLELRTSSLIDKAIREGTLDPSLKEEARKAIYGAVGDYLRKKREEREKDEKEKDEKITENSK